MKRLSIRQLLLSPTIAILLLLSNALMAMEFEFPEELTIKVGNREIKGFMGDPDHLKQVAAEIVVNPDSARAQQFPKEGFVYRPNYGAQDGFDVVAWSNQGDMKQILKVASSNLSGLIQAQGAPVGTVTSALSKNSYGKATVVRGIPAVKEPKQAKEQPAYVVRPRPDRQISKDTKLVMAASVAPQLEEKVSYLSKGIDWKYVLIIVGMLVLLGVFTRLAFIL